MHIHAYYIMNARVSAYDKHDNDDWGDDHDCWVEHKHMNTCIPKLTYQCDSVYGHSCLCIDAQQTMCWRDCDWLSCSAQQGHTCRHLMPAHQWVLISCKLDTTALKRAYDVSIWCDLLYYVTQPDGLMLITTIPLDLGHWCLLLNAVLNRQYADNVDYLAVPSRDVLELRIDGFDHMHKRECWIYYYLSTAASLWKV